MPRHRSDLTPTQRLLLSALPPDGGWRDIVQIAEICDGSVHTIRQALLALHKAGKLARRIEDGCAVYAQLGAAGLETNSQPLSRIDGR
jgi:DNA-binding GntR family transcriptional regulator